MDRAIELAADHGMYLVAPCNAKSLMRGGNATYGGGGKGKRVVCWTTHRRNAVGARENASATNPLIVASFPSTLSICRVSYGMLSSLAGQIPRLMVLLMMRHLDQGTRVIENRRRWATEKVWHVD